MSNPNIETVDEQGGKWLLLLAAAFVVAGLIGFYALSREAVYVRAVALFAGLALGVVIVLISGPGKRFVGFGRESYREVRKVVWPSRKESMQTTGVVFGFVLLMAAFMWIADKLIEWGVFSLILGWK
ncbi:MAG: preprotein translocase subunit SecE [Candidatus Protistobacter heckmanni]|nr:preprotein translocase subunit SecE [Candidatus Protistobacter heckmanni]